MTINIKKYQKHRIKFLILASLLFFGFTSLVHSQSPSPLPPIESVSLEQLKRDYFFQIEKYHEVEEKFNFERAEYRKLSTLANLEDALNATKELMISRARTFRSYLAIVERQLVDTPNIDTELRVATQERLRESQLALKIHEDEVPNLFDRDNILSTSSNFEANLDPAYESQYRGLGLIAANKVQGTFDDLVLAANDFEHQVVLLMEDEAFKAANLRGLKEVSTQLNLAKAALEKAYLTYGKFDEQTKTDQFRGTYNQMVNDLLPAVNAMNKAVDFLIELERGI